MQNKEICGEKSVNEKNLEVFNRYFPGCLSVENDNKLTLNVGRLKALLGDFSEIKEEGYGLDFVGKKIALNQAFKKNNKILKPLNESTSKHILIKGDNLDALKILRQSYSEKIKMIYIDPPYNTKNENFIYSDDFSQSNEEILKTLDYSKEKLDYIKNLFGSKCHSGWLSFMYPRLLLARDLLKQDGVIFISIDDNECAQLKLLCDEIFGEGNFVGQIVRATGTSTGQDSNQFGCSYDMCLCYAKNKEKFNLQGIPLNDKDIKRFKYDDNDGKGKYALLQLRKTGNNDKKEDREKMFYPITAPNGSSVFPLGPKNAYLSRWRVGYSTYKKWEKENLIVWKTDESVVDVLESDDFIENDEIKNDLDYSTHAHEYKEIDLEKYSSKYKPYVKYYLKGRTKAVSDLWIDIEGNKKGSIEIKNLFEKNAIFSNPKPLDFLNRIIEIATNEGDLILDFFAGSGTTAHAVLESNKSDYQKLSEGGGGSYLMA
ncbi:site-specific DNA-methyltransferase [Helicobacter pylori]|nr:site-specific DNA-methyltransferase [Helicobacter pylori]